uniref:Retrotransposon gag domain-containing protein n=1 Tax=Fagus sylvatica TaxID=28930 RepID=A0A2N9IF87_FAGSY
MATSTIDSLIPVTPTAPSSRRSSPSHHQTHTHPSAYLDGSSPPEPNPAHQAWLIQDQMILSALISSLSENVLAYVVKCTTSRDVWLTLERMFTAHSRARTMTIRYQLSTLKKGDSSIADYFHTFTGLVDTLAAINQPLTEEEQISFLLAGLGSEYESFITTVHMRTELLSIETLYGHLYLRNSAWSRPNPRLICLLQGLTLPAVADLLLVGIVMVGSLLPITLLPSSSGYT